MNLKDEKGKRTGVPWPINRTINPTRLFHESFEPEDSWNTVDRALLPTQGGGRAGGKACGEVRVET